VYNHLKKVRLAAGLSIEKAAKKLSIPAGYLSQIENGKRSVGVQRAKEIAKFYGVDVSDIFLPSRYSIREVDTTGKLAK
jgi:transcriptional regulator with XRE-family HTH domain